MATKRTKAEEEELELSSELTAAKKEKEDFYEAEHEDAETLKAAALAGVSTTEFDWTSVGKKTDIYSDEERNEMEKMYDATLTSIMVHQLLEGTVVSKNKKEVVVNIGYKSDGVISASEFRNNPDLKVGDKVEVYVEIQEDKNGQLVLSHQKARTLKAWERINQALVSEEVVQGSVKCRTKGGLIVDVFGIEAFLPGSQIDVKPIRDYDIYVNKTMEFKVVKINHEFRNVVVSHKALIEAELEQQKMQIMSKLEKGQVLEGTVKNITSYGVFMDLGGVDGLIHITDLSWGRISHPEEIVKLDQKINVVILDFDDAKKRIALGLKQLSPHPWDSLDQNMKVGDKITGKVVVVADYGAFVEISSGVEGLIHVSEMSWSQHLRTAHDFFKVGDAVDAVVMTLDREERKMSLSTRRLAPDPWESIEEKFPQNSKQKGRVTNISNFGVFVELAEGIDGLVHISDLSWSKKINHPSEFTKVGNEMEVVILEIDKVQRRLSLGHKQMEDNPWEVFETIFTVGSIHQGTLVSKNEKGAIVRLPYDVEGFAPDKHTVKQDGTKPEVGDTLDFTVIEFSKEAKKIILSHARIYEKTAEDEEKKEQKSRDVKRKSTRKAIKEISKNLEKTTLGDIDALSNLKTEMDEAKKNENKSPQEGQAQ